MSLSEAVLEITEEMIREADDLKGQNELIWMALRNWAKQLKVAVRASEGTALSAEMKYDEQGRGTVFLHPDAQHFQMIERARKELREQKRASEAQEGDETRMAVCEGGPADGETVPLSAGMPAGAKTMIDGKVYVLSDKGVLVWEDK